MQSPLLYPMALMVFYIFVIGMLNFRVRYKAIKGRQVALGHFRAYDKEFPKHLIVWGRHYDNQFQLPPIFLITVGLHLLFGGHGLLEILLAWAFVLTRMVHSWIHLGTNNVPLRAQVYALGWIIILALWVSLLI